MARRPLLLVVLLVASAVPAIAAGHGGDHKLDGSLRLRAHSGSGTSRLILQTIVGSNVETLIVSLGGTPGRRLPGMRGQVALIPDRALDALADDPRVSALMRDRPVHGTLERTAAATGAAWAHASLGLDGSGVGVAIIDSGVTAWHDDLGAQRVVHFADFVDLRPAAYDDYGHGTHVAGIIAGDGYDSNGTRRGMAPGARLVVLKVLDGDGQGHISNVIAALDYAVDNRVRFNIRVVNLSVAAGVHQSFTTDPLTLAARRAVEAGIVVVTAAGNFGRNAKNEVQYGGITSPGNAPWVLTVGASTHQGTAARGDDEVAAFSSRGPSYFDYAAKPDLVAPGVGIESLSDGASLLFSAHPSARLWGAVDTVTPPYLSLSGTSMAAPVVTGTVALMLQANPALTPNLVKAILQYTAERRPRYDDLTQGGGFLNARGAVLLASSFSADPSAPAMAKDPTPWNAHINWGNHRIGGGVLDPRGSAWRTDVMWGAPTSADGEPITWGTACRGGECGTPIRGSVSRDRVGGETACVEAGCPPAAWGTSSTASAANVVWDSIGCTSDGCAAILPSLEREASRTRPGAPSGAPRGPDEGQGAPQ